MILLLWLLAAAATQPYHDRTFDSRIFAQPRHYRLFLPAGYAESSRRYPVIYYFHGHSDRYTLERYDEGKDTVPAIARFVATHPVIVVAVDGYVAAHYTGFYGGAPYDISRDGGRYDFGQHFHELTAHIDSTLRTLPTRRYRATSGLSMGGYMSLSLSSRFPDFIGSASAFNPSHEMFAGEPGRRSLWRTTDHPANHAGSMIRLIRASGDYISQYHEEMRAVYAAAPGVGFEFRQDEYHRHWATSIEETFAFHMRAFDNPSLDTAPEEWTYTSARLQFAVRGYEAAAQTSEPALITLSDVRQGGFTVTSRHYAPDGPPAACTLLIRTAPLYAAGERYTVYDLPLTAATATPTEAVADASGRLTVHTDCAGHAFSFSGSGAGGQPPLTLPWTATGPWRARPNQTLHPPLRLYNPRATPLENVRVELTSEYPTVEITNPSTSLASLPAATSVDLAPHLALRFTAGAGGFARVRLLMKVTYDGYFTRTTPIDVLVAPDHFETPLEVAVLDGRSLAVREFRQKGNQGGGAPVERTVTEGKGNGNGILEPGEDATLWVRVRQGLDPFDKGNWRRAKVYSPSPLLTEVADIQEDKQREWTGARNRTSLVHLAATAAGPPIDLILDCETYSFHFTPDVRYGAQPLYQAFQLHHHHLFLWPLALSPATGAATQPSAAQPAATGLVLSNDAWPRATTLAEWTADVMRISGVERASETARGKAFFEWLRLFSRMAVGGMIQAYEGPRGKEAYVLDAHKQLFVYGWGFCDTTSRIAEAAWQEYKRDPRSAERVITQHDDGGYHTMYRLRLDGRYAAFDPRYGYYLIESDSPTARILDWSELHGRFELNRAYANRSRPFFEIAGLEWQRALLLQPAWFDSEDAWRKAGAPKENVFGDGAYRMGAPFHDMTFTLPRGSTVTRYWDNSARKFYVPAGAHTKREWPFLPSGRFYRVTDSSHGGNWPAHDPNYRRAQPYLATIPDGQGYPHDLAGGRTIGQAYGVIESTRLVSLTNGQAVVDFISPFVLVDGTVETPANTAIEIRTLQAKPRNTAEPDLWSPWSPLPAAGTLDAIHGVYRFQLRLRAASPVRLVTKLYFENGIMSIPPLFAGRNTLRLRAAPGSIDAPVTITYRYDTASGETSWSRTLQPAAFASGEAVFTADAPGLIRCRSVSIAY